MKRIEDVLGEYIRLYECRNYSQSTVVQIRDSIEGFASANRLKKIESIAPKHIEQYQYHLASRNLKANTIRLRLRRMGNFLAHLKQRNMILFDPWTFITMPKKELNLPRNVLTEYEMTRLLALPMLNTKKGLRLRAIVELFYGTAIRRSELVNLDIHDLNFKERLLTVREGKMKKDRILPVPKTTIKHVTEYVTRLRRQAKPTDKALILNWCGRRMTKHGLSTIIRDLNQTAQDQIGFKKHISCHVFRHTIATHLVERGVDLRYIQAFLGHAQLSSTQIYTHMAIRHLANEIDRCHPRGKMSVPFQ